MALFLCSQSGGASSTYGHFWHQKHNMATSLVPNLVCADITMGDVTVKRAGVSVRCDERADEADSVNVKDRMR